MSAEEQRRLLHVVIVGGGPTGVEFGGELYDFLQEVSRAIDNLQRFRTSRASTRSCARSST